MTRYKFIIRVIVLNVGILEGVTGWFHFMDYEISNNILGLTS